MVKGTPKYRKSRSKHCVLFFLTLFSLLFYIPGPKQFDGDTCHSSDTAGAILQDPKLGVRGNCFYIMKLYFQEGRQTLIAFCLLLSVILSRGLGQDTIVQVNNF